MPHEPRRISATGYYHVVPKGIADQILFGDDSDRYFYLDELRHAKQELDVLVHAYCLMSNHVHLLIEDPANNLAAFLKRVHERYGMHYARKIGRTGGIFRNHPWSEPVERDSYLLCAMRYIHANPAAAGICRASQYEWSSAKDFLGRKGLTDTRMILDMLGGRDAFIAFSQESNNTALPFPGSKLRRHLSDDEALAIACSVLGTSDCSLGSKKEPEQEAIVRLLSEHGFTTAQMIRITGLGKNVIARHLA